MKKLNMEFLAFLQEQIIERENIPNKKEQMLLSLVWEQYLNSKGIYLSIGERAKTVWKEVEAYRKKKSTAN
jgi:Mor family transcriptional regulator